MIVIVRNIEIDTQISDQGYEDTFVNGMELLIDQKIDVEPYKHTNWYQTTNRTKSPIVRLHRSWLIMLNNHNELNKSLRAMRRN